MPTVTVSSRRRNVVSIDSSMQKRITWSPILLTILIVLLFLGGLIYGAVSIPLESVIDILLGKDIGRPAWQNIILQSRFPQAVTALLAGASLATSGLLLQTLFRNRWQVPLSWVSATVQTWEWLPSCSISAEPSVW